jgi:hypothetical protein
VCTCGVGSNSRFSNILEPAVTSEAGAVELPEAASLFANEQVARDHAAGRAKIGQGY